MTINHDYLSSKEKRMIATWLQWNINSTYVLYYYHKQFIY